MNLPSRRLLLHAALSSLALAAGAFVPESRAQSYTTYDLGTLGGAYSEADSINNSGQIVGYSELSGGTSTRATLSTLSLSGVVTTTPLGTLGGNFSYANAINDAGVIVGTSQTSGSTANYAVIYAAGGAAPTVLGTLGGTNSQAFALNNGGQIVGLSTTSGNTPVRATLFPANGSAAMSLGTLGGTGSQAVAINNPGQIVGVSQTTGSSTTHAALFSSTGSAPTDLGTLPGGTSSSALAVSSAGVVVGGSTFTGSANPHAVVFSTSGGTPTDLGTLAGGTGSVAYGVNGAGQIVGNSTYGGGGNDQHAFVYTAATGMQDVNALIPANSAVTDIAVSGTGNQINDFGQVVGLGVVANGEVHAVLLNPVNPLHTATGPSQDTRLVGGMGYTKTPAFSNPTTGALGSTVAFLGGTAGSGGNSTYGLNRDLVTTFASVTLSLRMASDVVNVSGSGTDKFVLQLSYNQALAATALGGENNAMLFWLDPTDGNYKLAVLGNSSGTPRFIQGAYDPAVDFQLGYYGVDTATHTAWAVLDHNSNFVVSTTVPEPSSVACALLGLGGGFLLARRVTHQTAA